MKKILFVCTGNTCRSCMAEAILGNEIIKDLELAGRFTAASAGLTAFDGDPASPDAITVLKELYDLDLHTHRSKRISIKDIEESLLVLTMTREHKKVILSIVPQFESKVFTLNEYVNNRKADKTIEEYNYSLDIPDPYGMSLQVYKSCAGDIREAVDKLVQKLKLFFDIDNSIL